MNNWEYYKLYVFCINNFNNVFFIYRVNHGVFNHKLNFLTKCHQNRWIGLFYWHCNANFGTFCKKCVVFKNIVNPFSCYFGYLLVYIAIYIYWPVSHISAKFGQNGPSRFSPVLHIDIKNTDRHIVKKHFYWPKGTLNEYFHQS